MQFAAVFPGQGSQSLGMLTDLATEHPEVQQTFDEASDILSKNLWGMTKAESDEEINQTIYTQPLMLAAGVAVWRVWQKVGGGAPVAVAGHSLAEYTAMVASGVLDFRDTVKLVSKRAHLMQEAVPEGKGAMAAILGLDDLQIVDICSKLASVGVVEAVNFNSPGQVVIAGETEAVDAAIEKLSEAGAKRAIKLAMSVPSHCSLLKDAANDLSLILLETTFSDANYPIIQNVAARNNELVADRQTALSEQLYKPVLWVDCVNSLANDYAADTIFEFGPGKVLSGLNRRINRKLTSVCISDLASLEKALAMCNA